MKEAILRRPDVLEDMADRLQRAETQAVQLVTEIRSLQALYRRLSSEADAIAEATWKSNALARG